MRACSRFLALVVMAVALCAGSAAADMVIMKSGARVSGDVSTDGKTVRVTNPDGVLNIDSSLVARVIRTREAAPVSRPPQARTTAPADKAASVVPDGAGASSPDLQALLDRKMSVAFDDTPIAGILEYLQEVTGASFSYRRADLDRDPTGVTMHINDVTMRQVIELALEGRDLGWDVRSGIIRIRPKEELASGQPIHVYDIRDCLVNVEDRFGSGSSSLSTQTGSTTSGTTNASGSSGSSSGSSWGSSTSGTSTGTGSTGTSAVTAGETLAARAFSFASLITKTVRPETWGEPPVEQLGGDTQENGQSQEAGDIWQ